jgi:predicted outer membrane repeat protein
MAVAAVMAAGTGGALTALTVQAAQAQPPVAVPCSTSALASAVTGANVSGATLSLAAGCVYNLTAALPQVNQEFNINGNGATLQRSYAAGTAAFTILTVTGSGILTVNDLNFRHGAGAIAVIDEGQLTVNGGTFTANTAANGGAIYSNTQLYAPQINNATFVRNNAAECGGAIYSSSFNDSVYVSGSVFIGNKAADGGAIWEYGFGGEIGGSTFQGNSAGTGGALWLDEGYGEGLYGLTVRYNSALGDGGGIYAADDGEGMDIEGSTISGNHAGGQGGGFYDGDFNPAQVISSDIEGNSAADGAGIYNDLYTVFQLTGSTVSGNHASEDGGGIWNAADGPDSLTGSTISGNYAGGHGGGIYNQDGTDLTVASTSINDNRAHGGGGGIFDDGPDGSTALTSSKVTGNKPDNCEPPGSITGCKS